MKFSFHYLIFNNRDFKKHDVYVKLFALSFPVIPTWLILNLTRLGANVVTIFGFCFGLMGVFLGYYFSIEFLLYGFFIFLMLDFVDGNVALARGGGTFLGTIMDMTSDRIILFATVFTLIHYHIKNSQDLEIILLVAYILSFVFLDILQLAFLLAKRNMGSAKEEEKGNREPNDFKKIFSNPIIWIPSRLSSYLFMIIAILISGTFSTAYWIGIFCVFGEFITQVVKYKKTLLQPDSE